MIIVINAGLVVIIITILLMIISSTQAEDKFAESLHLAQMGMFNIMENDVEQVNFSILSFCLAMVVVICVTFVFGDLLLMTIVMMRL